MLRRSLHLVVACIVLQALCHSSRAQETLPTIGKAPIAQAEAALFERLVQDPGSTVDRGFVQSMAAPSGSLFLVVWLDLKIVPGKSESGDETTQVGEPNIRLLAGKTALGAVGRCTRDGRFTVYAGDFQFYGKPNAATVPWDLVFLVPAKSREFTLRFGDASQKLTVQAKPAPTIERGAIASFEVSKVTVIDKLVSKQRLGPYDQPQAEANVLVESASKRYVVVELIVKPKARNSEYGFNFSTSDIGLQFGSQVALSPVGYVSYGEFSPNTTTLSSQQDAAGSYAAVAATIVYPLPGKLTKFQVTYLLDPVATGSASQ